MVRMLNKFMATSAMFSRKESPFLGMEEKEIGKDALLGLFKVEERKRVVIPEEGLKLRNRLIDQFWD